jgi:c-di-GMP-binding flagellar brake protein YcgR
MNDSSISLPTSRQTVKIILDEEKEELQEIYAVVDVVTLDGRVKVFCLENLDEGPLKLNSSILLEYGYNDALYRSSWHIDYVENGFKNEKEEKPSLLLLSPDYDSKRIQRRQYFRLPVELKLRFKNVVFPRDFVPNFQLRKEMVQIWHIEKKSFPHFGETIDISEGGICYTTKSTLKKGDELAVELHLPNESIVSPAIVMWSTFTENDNEVLQKVGIQFVCDRLQEKKIIRDYIFNEQRRQLQDKKINKEISKVPQ